MLLIRPVACYSEHRLRRIGHGRDLCQADGLYRRADAQVAEVFWTDVAGVGQ